MKKNNKLATILLASSLLLPGIAPLASGVASVSAAPATSIAVDYDEEYVVPMVDQVVRHTNAENASPVAFVKRGEDVKFVKVHDNKWFKVSVDGKEGFVLRGDVTSRDNFESEDTKIHDLKVTKQSGMEKHYYVAAHTALRTSNADRYRPLKFLIRETRVEYLGTTDSNEGWFKVKLDDGTIGYIDRANVTTKENLDANGGAVNVETTTEASLEGKKLDVVMLSALRTQPGRQYRVIKELPRNTVVKYLGTTVKNKQWLKVELTDGTETIFGYVDRGHVTKLAEDTTKLEAAKAAAAKLNEKDYTEASWKALTAALNLPEKTQAEIDAKVVAIEKAIADLEAAALKVESVSAINAKTIDVTFNQEMDKATAEAAITVKKVGSDDALTASKTLQSDKKTVRVVLTNAMANATGYDVKVAATAKTVKGEKLEKDYVHTFQFNDTVAPTVSKIETLSTGAVKISFSEELAVTAGKVTINGYAYTVTPLAAASSVTIAKANLVDSTKAGLEKGKSYPVIVEGFTDVAATPNVMKLYTSTINYNYTADTVAPTVSSVVVKDEKTLTLTFSEELSGVNKDGSTDNTSAIGLKVTKGSAATKVLTSATTKDGKVFTINLDATPNKLFDSTATPKETKADLTVTLDGYKDLALNVGQKTEKKVTVTKDQTAPTITDVDYDFGAEEIVFTTSKSLDNNTSAYNSILTIVDENGVAVTVPSTLLAVTAGDEEIVLDNSSAALNLNPGTYKFTFAKDAFKDQALNGGNGNTEYTTTVVIPENAPNTDKTKPTVSSVSASNDTITVTFSEAVKGGEVNGSATNPANYQLAGKPLPTGTLITLDSARTVATIKLPTESIAKTETVLFSVSNVQDLAGNVIEANSQKTLAVTDTVKPVLEGVTYDSANNNLVLTFSENVNGVVSGDLEVKVNGIVATVAVESRLATDKGNVVRLSSSTVNLASGTITVTTKVNATGADTTGNKLKEDITVTLAR